MTAEANTLGRAAMHTGDLCLHYKSSIISNSFFRYSKIFVHRVVGMQDIYFREVKLESVWSVWKCLLFT